jgi:hypothetical protein
MQNDKARYGRGSTTQIVSHKSTYLQKVRVHGCVTFSNLVRYVLCGLGRHICESVVKDSVDKKSFITLLVRIVFVLVCLTVNVAVHIQNMHSYMP